MRKVRIDMRELENMKKRQSEDVDRLKEAELDKMRKEKRALDQR